MALIAVARRLRLVTAAKAVRTGAHRLAASGRAPARPGPPAAGLGLDGLDLSGLAVLDAPDGDEGADVVVLRDLDRAADPSGAVVRLRARTRVLAVIACPATEWPRQEELGLIEILPPDGPAVWSPSADGVRELCLAAGFGDVRIVAGPPAYRPRSRRPVHYRLVVHARP